MRKTGDATAPGGPVAPAPKPRTRTGDRVFVNGTRAVPGKVPRGARPVAPGRVFTPLGRMLLDRLDRGVILLDAAGRVVDANSHALQVLRTCDGLGVRCGRLSFSDPALEQRLQQAIARLRAGVRDTRAVIAARVRCAAPFRIIVVPVPPDADERDVAFFALLYTTGNQREITRELLGELYGLTQAQADVTRSLFAGHSVDETARLLDLSPNTVRTHLKQVFSKCEVNSQAELMHLLALGPQDL